MVPRACSRRGWTRWAVLVDEVLVRGDAVLAACSPAWARGGQRRCTWHVAACGRVVLFGRERHLVAQRSDLPLVERRRAGGSRGALGASLGSPGNDSAAEQSDQGDRDSARVSD